MTKEQLLKDTIDYYSKDPVGLRCVKNNGQGNVTCRYSPKNVNKPKSEGCGIGRHLSPEVKLRYDEEENNSIKEIFKDPELKAMAPKWMHRIGIKYLMAIQSLHDCTNHWTATGLSEAGKNQVSYLIWSFKLKKEDIFGSIEI
jgi:hypothetical protein